MLEVRTENLKSQRSRAEQFSSGGVTSSLPASATQVRFREDSSVWYYIAKGYHAGSVLAMEDDMAAAQGGDAVIDMGGSQLATINHDQDQYYSSRADAMHTIESTIVELGGIFSQLATMVKEQEEMVTRIDNNIDDTALNVELGHNEILKWVPAVIQ